MSVKLATEWINYHAPICDAGCDICQIARDILSSHSKKKFDLQKQIKAAKDTYDCLQDIYRKDTGRNYQW